MGIGPSADLGPSAIHTTSPGTPLSAAAGTVGERHPVAVLAASGHGSRWVVLDEMVAPEAGQAGVLPTAGSAPNVKHAGRHGVTSGSSGDLAVLHPGLEDQGGKRHHGSLVIPISTAGHYIPRADADEHLHDIKNAKINGGLVGSGAA
jgi:hypothetical protein